MVVAAVIIGIGRVIEPSTMPEGPRMMVEPSESVIVSIMLPIGYVVPPIIISGSKMGDEELVIGLEEMVSVVSETVVTDPSGSVEVVGRMVVSDWAPVGTEPEETTSVVPGIVVTDPPGSVEVSGGIIVNN
jgi:hypothetical protein